MPVSKPKNKRSLRFKVYFALFIVFAGLVIAACTPSITILSQQDNVTPGDTAHIVLNLKWEVINLAHTNRQVVGICVPKSWNVSQNTTMTYKSDAGNGNMVLIPANINEPSSGLPYPAAFLKKFGIGPNYINDMEWVVFWSDIALFGDNGATVSGQIYINIKTGTDNLSFRPGYAMCEDGDGLSDGNPGYYTNLFGTCMSVAAADAADIQDFCNPQIGTFEPSSATDNDIVTLIYNGSLDTTNLRKETDVYLCAKAYTTDGAVIDMCQQTSATKLTPSGVQQWRFDFWPRKFFNVPPKQSLQRIEYYFSNADGTLKTGYGNSSDPFKYVFKCR